METNSRTTLFCTAAAALVLLAGCSGGGGDDQANDPVVVNKDVPQSAVHLLLDGRQPSSIVIDNVGYPRPDGGTTVGRVVINVPGSMLQPGNTLAGYVNDSRGANFSLEFPPVEDAANVPERELDHNTRAVGFFTEAELGRDATNWGGRTIGGIHFRVEDTDTPITHKTVVYTCEHMSLIIRQIDAEWTGPEERTEISATSWRVTRTRHVVYRGIIDRGVIDVQSTSSGVGTSVIDFIPFNGKVFLNDHEFVWECDETVVVGASERINNPGHPFIGL